jgi:hypothetical protein
VTNAYSRNRTIVLTLNKERGRTMRLLRLAVETKRWDLAAHTIVLASARVLKNGDRPDGGKSKAKKRRPRG